MNQPPDTAASKVRIKICGITRARDARLAGDLGADAIGLNFYPHTPRGINLTQALEIMDAVAPFLTTVGVFVDPQPGEVKAVLQKLPLDLVQFHGGETARDCASVGRPYIKSITMHANVDLHQQAACYPTALALLLETPSDTLKGGTGRIFDWQLATEKISTPVILAGGLNPSNVAQAIRTVRPACVDANSGVESEPGIKDADKVAAFIREVQRVQTDEY